MKTEDVLNLDFRKSENKNIINGILTKNIKYFSDYKGKKIPQIEMENFIGFLSRKFNISIQWITPVFLDDETNMFSASIIRTDTREWLGNVYGCCMLELLSKTCIKMFWEVKINKIPVKEKRKVED